MEKLEEKITYNMVDIQIWANYPQSAKNEPELKIRSSGF